MAMTINGTSGVTYPDNTLATTAYSTRFRNRIINGDMRIDQRNAGAQITPTNGQWLVDRWIYYGSQASKFTAQQNAGAVTPPTGFTNYQGLTSTSAYSVGAGENFNLRQAIEGLNIADLGWGTANAKTITLSFWVYSSLTGTFGGSITNSAGNRAYVFSYSIPSANTWTQISITIPGDTSGTWLTTNGIGIQCWWSLGVGSTLSGTAGSWGSTAYYNATGSVSVVGTSGATFYITGVQLEVGSSATGFEYVDYTTQLSMCQRYFEKSYDQGTTAGTVTNNGAVWSYVFVNTGAITDIGTTMQFKVDKRTTSTMTFYSPDTGASGVVGSQSGDKSANIQYSGQHSAAVYATVSNANGQIRIHYTSSAEL